jgi:hypothetical protein
MKATLHVLLTLSMYNTMSVVDSASLREPHQVLLPCKLPPTFPGKTTNGRLPYLISIPPSRPTPFFPRTLPPFLSSPTHS